jgi:L-ascorbate oxidase
MTGPLVIEDPAEPFQYSEERTLMLTDWWHEQVRTLAAGLAQKTFRWVGDPASVLINGKGCFAKSVSKVQCTVNITCPSIDRAHVIDVEPGKTYRLRLINSGALSYLNFAIEGHVLTVVEIDGHYVEPYNTSSIELNTGERVSVLLTANQPVANYWAHAQIRFREQVSGQAVLRYKGAPLALPTTPLPTQYAAEPLTFPYSDSAFLNASTEFVRHANKIVASPAQSLAYGGCPGNNSSKSKLFVVVGTQERMDRDGMVSYTPYRFPPGGADKWTGNVNVDPAYAGSFGWYDDKTVDGKGRADGWMKWPLAISMPGDSNARLPEGGTAMELPATPLLLAIYYKVYDEPGQPPPHNLLFLEEGDVVTIVLQNARALNGRMEQHPWHLHGHTFWVIGRGVGLWSESAAREYNTVNPPLQDVITLYPFTWVAIRFIADNPGVHGFHCHIDWHLEMGMHTHFVEMASKIPPPPPDLPICGGITSELITKRAAVNAAPTSTPARASAAPTGSVSDHTIGLGIGLPVGLIVGLGIGVFATMVLMQRQQRRQQGVKHQRSGGGAEMLS